MSETKRTEMKFNPDLSGVLKGRTSRYSLVIATAKRARQLIDGAEPYVEVENNKALSIAIEELYRSKVKILSDEEPAEEEEIAEDAEVTEETEA